ncbi:DUF3429 domain-containing protein [Brevundimonas naejangsanensis]|uniref:DUF3429 domain-containing protein n=1 Tax=Brevundimonas naejangsanensis TaxID=588932 RepID=A0A494RHH3_9CAUL|nr:DUF3429 domain-containing protein [Brevundimonas naejangsanensis]AYG93950.1 DUF3429 domain-containing protein [Brevundimonas naejangsanensis]
MTQAPRPAMILGWSGVLPFAVLTGALAFGLGDPDQVAGALRLYGAVILSFMGGVHWGVATLRSEARLSPYAVSVLPALGHGVRPDADRSGPAGRRFLALSGL